MFSNPCQSHAAGRSTMHRTAMDPAWDSKHAASHLREHETRKHSWSQAAVQVSNFTHERPSCTQSFLKPDGLTRGLLHNVNKFASNWKAAATRFVSSQAHLVPKGFMFSRGKTNNFGERFGSLEQQLVEQDLRIAKLEAVLASYGPEMTPLSDLDDKIADLQSQIVALREANTPKEKYFSNIPGLSKTMVVGGLQGLGSLHSATTWLHKKLQEMNAPQPVETYMKSEIFNGLVFAKFGATYDRDIAVATLRSAKFTHDDNRIWATQDLPIPARAKKLFLLGLRWQLGEWGFEKREMETDDHYTKLLIANKTVVQVDCVKDELRVVWAPDWAA